MSRTKRGIKPDYANLKKALNQLKDQVDIAARVATDPIRFPHRYSNLRDQEVVSLFAALLAYGRVSAIGGAVENVLKRMGDFPAQAAVEDARKWRLERQIPDRFEGFVYRFTRGGDLVKLWIGVGNLLIDHECLGDMMRGAISRDDETLINAYQHLYDQLQAQSIGIERGRGFSHLLSNPSRGSALKRINMWLRWLVRGPDQVDFGAWSDLGAERLILPLDVHTFRLSTALGLTTRRTADLKTAIEITKHLRILDPQDPISYDFALAHLGISGACKGYRVREICTQCPLQDLCMLT